MKHCIQYIVKTTLLVIFSSFLYFMSEAQSSVVDIGKSYANITKLATGGTFNPNDIIEVRVTFAVANVAPSQITAVQVYDTVPAKTTFVPNSIRISTNEGITYKGPYTDAADADQGKCVGGNILINIGAGATSAVGGTVKSTDRPSFYTNTCILVACYRVQINSSANYGDTITIGGKATYSVSGVPTTVNFRKVKIILTQLNIIPCSNGTAVSAAGDSLGTFASGSVQNRASSLAFATTYTKQNISTGNPQDYNYSIVNNSSADGSTNPNSAMPESPSLHRVFGLWDIAGDHTGSVNKAIGNSPKAPGARGGYMVLINAAYKTDTAYRESLINLCPNTYYEFSAWFRNLCPRCGCDSTGKGSGSSGYITGPGNDSSGVKPNISFEIDGLSYYTSGDIRYDRTTPWKKFGFTFLTKANQTTANFLIRNNSPGGGGNDWALDDIAVSHCGPTMAMNYNPQVLGCSAAPFVVTLSDTIRYLYSNSYIYYQWQVSNVGGTVWSNLSGPGTSGVGSPVIVNGQYQYVTNLPPFLATAADSGKYYRVITATSLANLTTSCAYNDQSATLIKVINCGIVLSANFLQVNGQLVENKATLSWSSSDEEDIKIYEIERSYDGETFHQVSAVYPKNLKNAFYKFTDPDDVYGRYYYRIKMIDNNGLYKYSKIVLVSTEMSFEVQNLTNPVKNNIKCDLVVPEDGRVNFNLYNDLGVPVKKIQRQVSKGFNSIQIDKLNFPYGIYILTIEYNNEVIRKKLIKQE